MFKRFNASGIVRAVAVLTFAPLAAWGSAVSEENTRNGINYLAHGKAEAARQALELAVKADATDAQAVFYLGTAYNRLGRYSEARRALRFSADNGYVHPDADFEAGWAAMGTGDYAACLTLLQRFEHQTPGRAQTSEFLGRCSLESGATDDAARHLEEALRRDPALLPTVELYRARLALLRQDPDAARKSFTALASSQSEVGRALRQSAVLAAAIAPPPPAWAFGVTTTVGHNDNVIGLGNTTPLPTDISSKKANFFRMNAGLAYTHWTSQRTAFRAGYALLLDRYDGIGAANLDDHFLYGDWFHALTPKTDLSFRISHEYTYVGSNRLRNVTALRPAVSYRFTNHSQTEFAVSHALSSYHANVQQAFNRDGKSNTLSATHYFRLPDSRWRFALGGTYTANRTTGNDFSFDGHGLSASVRYDFPKKVMAVIGVAQNFQYYRNANSLTGSRFVRNDEQLVLSGQLSGPLTPSVNWYAQVQKLKNASNVSFYAFRQNVISIGIGANF